MDVSSGDAVHASILKKEDVMDEPSKTKELSTSYDRTRLAGSDSVSSHIEIVQQEDNLELHPCNDADPIPLSNSVKRPPLSNRLHSLWIESFSSKKPSSAEHDNADVYVEENTPRNFVTDVNEHPLSRQNPLWISTANRSKLNHEVGT
jgi:hypothetical protein